MINETKRRLTVSRRLDRQADNAEPKYDLAAIQCKTCGHVNNIALNGALGIACLGCRREIELVPEPK